MAPEIYFKQHHYGKPVDIWALGISFYKLLYGIYPFDIRKNMKKEDFRFDQTMHKDENTFLFFKSVFAYEPEKRLDCHKFLK